MKHKDKVLQEIMDQVTELFEAGEIDSMRVEIMRKGTRTVKVTDGSMLTVPEISRIVGNGGSVPALRLVS